MKPMGKITEEKGIDGLINSKEKDEEHNTDTDIPQIIIEKGEKNKVGEMKPMGQITEEKEIDVLINSKEKNEEHNTDMDIPQIIIEKGKKIRLIK